VEEEETHWLIKHFSWGDIITLVVLLIAFVGGYTSLSKDVETLKGSVAILQSRDITPGAAQRLGVVEERVKQGDEEDKKLREELRELRTEILDELREMNNKLERHMEKRHE